MKLQIKAEYKDDFVDIGTIETHPAVGGVFSYARCSCMRSSCGRSI